MASRRFRFAHSQPIDFDSGIGSCRNLKGYLGFKSFFARFFTKFRQMQFMYWCMQKFKSLPGFQKLFQMQTICYILEYKILRYMKFRLLKIQKISRISQTHNITRIPQTFKHIRALQNFQLTIDETSTWAKTIAIRDECPTAVEEEQRRSV